MKYKSETLTEVVADRKRAVDFHAALETSLQTEEKLYFPFYLFTQYVLGLLFIHLCYYSMH